jgi:hypothetical protein
MTARMGSPDGLKKDISRAIPIKVQKFPPHGQVVIRKKPKEDPLCEKNPVFIQGLIQN